MGCLCGEIVWPTGTSSVTIARERLADTLLARSVEGNVEQIWREGELVGERHVIDNRLGLAILRRLDRLAEMGMAVSTIGQHVTLKYTPRSTPACNPQAIDWSVALDALRTGDDVLVAKALALFDGDKVEEVEGPPNPSNDGDTRAGLPGAGRACGRNDSEETDLSDRCWAQDEMGETVWMTSFPPPQGFDGYQKGDPSEFGYERECTPERSPIARGQ